MDRVGIIGGTGVYDLEAWTSGPEKQSLLTPYGDAQFLRGFLDDVEVIFMARHGQGHSVPPHRINYRANLWAFKKLGVTRVMATAAVGSLSEKYPPGNLVLLGDFLDFTKSRPQTFFDNGEHGVVHIDLTEPYCRELSSQLIAAAQGLGTTLLEGAVYVCTEGPRFESTAEIQMFRRLGGDLVGMTGVPEVVLAREAGICYQAVALVTNWAAGLQGQPLTHREVLEVMAANGAQVKNLFAQTARNLGQPRTCSCSGLGAQALPGEGDDA